LKPTTFTVHDDVAGSSEADNVQLTKACLNERRMMDSRAAAAEQLKLPTFSDALRQRRAVDAVRHANRRFL